MLPNLLTLKSTDDTVLEKLPIAVSNQQNTSSQELSLLYEGFQQYANETKEPLTEDPPTYYHHYKTLTEDALRQSLQRAGFFFLIETSKSILSDYLKLFPFQPEYIEKILQDVDTFYSTLQNKGPFYYGLSNLHDILTKLSGISRHFARAENMISSRFQVDDKTYNSVFSVSKEELYDHIAYQPQSLLYYANMLNADKRMRMS